LAVTNFGVCDSLSSFGGYGLALAALALAVFGAIGSIPIEKALRHKMVDLEIIFRLNSFHYNSFQHWRRNERLKKN